MESVMKYIKKYGKIIKYIIIFLFALAIAYKNNFKSSKKNELLLIWQNKCYHIHHWITYGILICSLYINYYLPLEFIHIITVFLLGLIAEDLFYRDIFQIREPCSKSFTLSSKVYDKR
jgi:hypothetical protein